MKIKSPLRFIAALLVLCLVLYGIVTAVSALSGGEIHFGFWGSSVVQQTTVQNFVVAGVDEEEVRTDIILLCQYDLVNNKLTAVQIPRDTKVETERADKKINSAYGTKEKEQALMEDLENLTGIKAEKYAIVTLKGFREIIDAIGGVEVDVPIRMYYTDPVQGLYIDLKKGRQTLNGKQAEMFMRFRSNNDGTGYPDGDIGRNKAQKEFYNALADKLLSGSTVWKAPKLLSIIQDNLKTNFTGEEILSYAGKALKLKKENISILQLPGEADYINKVSYFIADEDATKELIAQNFVTGETVQDKQVESSFKNRFIKIELIDATGLSVEEADVLRLVREELEQYGFRVVSTSTAAQTQESSKLIEHNAKNASEEVLKIYDGLPVTNDGNTEAECDITIVIGSDFRF